MEKTFRVVQVGCGNMAKTWVKYALNRADTEIVALVDLNLEAAKKMAQSYDIACPVFTDLEQAIQQTGANLVFDCTIPDVHFQIAVTAMRLGCDVFGEKPLATSLEQGKKMIQISEETGRNLIVMQNRRFDPKIRAVRQMITDQTIGKPGIIGADFFLGPHFGGFREQMESPLLLDMAIHTFDQARYILGADPISVYCHEFNPAGSWFEGNAAAICIFEMSDGTIFNYRGSWCAEGAPTSWQSSWRITGEKGTIIWDGSHAPYAEVIPAEGEKGNFMRQTVKVEAPKIENLNDSLHSNCLDEMFASLIEKRRAETDSRDNIKSMAMVFAAIESARKGEKINIRHLL